MVSITLVPKHCLLLLIRAYRYFLSPWLGRNCRFYPTCSQYALEAVDRHGAIKGAGYVVCRLVKCHPLHSGGVDLVP